MQVLIALYYIVVQLIGILVWFLCHCTVNLEVIKKIITMKEVSTSTIMGILFMLIIFCEIL